MTANSCSTSPRSRLEVGSSRIEHLGVEHHRSSDRDELLDRDRVAGEHRAGVDREAEALQMALGAPVGRPPVDAPAAARLVPEHHVLAHREVGAEVHLLVHGGDAGVLRVGRAGEALLVTADADGAGIHRIDPGESLDEARLAGAVLAHERVHLTGPEREVDVVEREDAGEPDGDAGHLDDRRDCGVHVHGDSAFPSFIAAHPPGDLSVPRRRALDLPCYRCARDRVGISTRARR